MSPTPPGGRAHGDAGSPPAPSVPTPTPLIRNSVTAALSYAAAGWPVFPCIHGTKRPAVPRGFRAATTNVDVVAAMFTGKRAPNLATPTGILFDVLDLDRKPGGPDATHLVDQLRAEGWLDGLAGVATTRNRGLHLYFPASGSPSGSIPRLGVDFKGAGGYVLLAPSWVPADFPTLGGTYQWDHFPDVKHGAPLDWEALRARLDPRHDPNPTPTHPGDPDRRVAGILRTVTDAQPGTRNRALFWAACRLTELGVLAAVRDQLLVAAHAAGLDTAEALPTIASAARTAVTR